MTAAEGRQGFLSTPFPSLAATPAVHDMTGSTGCVVIDLDEGGCYQLQIYSEAQARALIEAAGNAAAMFAGQKMRGLSMNPTTHQLERRAEFIEVAAQ